MQPGEPLLACQWQVLHSPTPKDSLEHQKEPRGVLEAATSEHVTVEALLTAWSHLQPPRPQARLPSMLPAHFPHGVPPEIIYCCDKEQQPFTEESFLTS